MVLSCSAYNCTNRCQKYQETGENIKFHSFPLKNKDLLKKWINAMRRDKWIPTRYSFVCGAHFRPEDYRKDGGKGKGRRLKENAVPSIFNFHLKRPVSSRGASLRSLPRNEKNYEPEEKLARHDTLTGDEFNIIQRECTAALGTQTGELDDEKNRFSNKNCKDC